MKKILCIFTIMALLIVTACGNEIKENVLVEQENESGKEVVPGSENVLEFSNGLLGIANLQLNDVPPLFKGLKSNPEDVEAEGNTWLFQLEATDNVTPLEIQTEIQDLAPEELEVQEEMVESQIEPIEILEEETESQLESTVEEVEMVIDTEAPVIAGVHEIEVYLGDNIDEEVTLVVDNSKVNKNSAGVYPVYYSATDAAGNETIEETVIHIKEVILDEAHIQPMIDAVIAEVTTPEMSTWDKMFVLWEWCRTKITYATTAGNRSSLWAGAYEGLHNRKGDCFVYYATYTLLLNRIGVENMCVSRVGGTSNHWWSLVCWNGKWYHTDSSPRKAGHAYECFMQTDAQIQEYSNFYVEKVNYYNFDTTLYPERGKEIIYDGWAKSRNMGN